MPAKEVQETTRIRITSASTASKKITAAKREIAEKYLTINGRTTVMMMPSDDEAIDGDSD